MNSAAFTIYFVLAILTGCLWVTPCAAAQEDAPRPNMVYIMADDYNIGPFFAAVRKGDWKLVWQTVLPSRIELFNLAQTRQKKPTSPTRIPRKWLS